MAKFIIAVGGKRIGLTHEKKRILDQAIKDGRCPEFRTPYGVKAFFREQFAALRNPSLLGTQVRQQ